MSHPSSLSQSEPGCSTPVGVVNTNDLYTLAEAKSRLGWTDAALRSAKRRGLKLLSCGKRRYITGEEIIRFLKSL